MVWSHPEPCLEGFPFRTFVQCSGELVFAPHFCPVYRLAVSTLCVAHAVLGSGPLLEQSSTVWVLVVAEVSLSGNTESPHHIVRHWNKQYEWQLWVTCVTPVLRIVWVMCLSRQPSMLGWSEKRLKFEWSLRFSMNYLKLGGTTWNGHGSHQPVRVA